MPAPHAVISSIFMQLIVVNVHFFNDLLKTVPLGPLDWVLIIAVSSTVLIAVEIGKKEKGFMARIFPSKKQGKGENRHAQIKPTIERN